MFVTALVGVAVGFGFLVTALATQASAWAWGCIFACVVAAVLLVVDTRRRRRAGPMGSQRPPAETDDEYPTDSLANSGLIARSDQEPRTGPEASEPTGARSADSSLTEAEEERVDTDAAARIAESDQDVFVVDEQPLYHLAYCSRAGSSRTMSVPVREAVSLGFVPCGRCTPVRNMLAEAQWTP